MKLARLYVLVGAAAGLLLGAAAALGAMAVAFGASWVFLFGDEPWPDAVGPVVLGLGALIALFLLAMGVWAGHRFGSHYERAPPETRRIARRRAHIMLRIWGATMLALIIGGAAASFRSDAEREADAGRERSFVDLVERRHVIERVEIAADPPTLRIATLRLRGRRGGEYRLDWMLDEDTYGTVLDEGARRLSLTGGGEEVELRFELAALRETYRDRVLSGAGAVLVEEDFRLHMTLTPLLTEAERGSIPAREVHNLELGVSDLVTKAVGAIPVRFEIR